MLLFYCCQQLGWVHDINKRNTSEELARSVAEAEHLLELHQERKVSRACTWLLQLAVCEPSSVLHIQKEMNSKEENFSKIRKTGEVYIGSNQKIQSTDGIDVDSWFLAGFGLWGAFCLKWDHFSSPYSRRGAQKFVDDLGEAAASIQTVQGASGELSQCSPWNNENRL